MSGKPDQDELVTLEQLGQTFSSISDASSSISDEYLSYVRWVPLPLKMPEEDISKKIKELAVDLGKATDMAIKLSKPIPGVGSITPEIHYLNYRGLTEAIINYVILIEQCLSHRNSLYGKNTTDKEIALYNAQINDCLKKYLQNINSQEGKAVVILFTQDLLINRLRTVAKKNLMFSDLLNYDEETCEGENAKSIIRIKLIFDNSIKQILKQGSYSNAAKQYLLASFDRLLQIGVQAKIKQVNVMKKAFNSLKKWLSGIKSENKSSNSALSELESITPKIGDQVLKQSVPEAPKGWLSRLLDVLFRRNSVVDYAPKIKKTQQEMSEITEKLKGLYKKLKEQTNNCIEAGTTCITEIESFTIREGALDFKNSERKKEFSSLSEKATSESNARNALKTTESEISKQLEKVYSLHQQLIDLQAKSEKQKKLSHGSSTDEKPPITLSRRGSSAVDVMPPSSRRGSGAVDVTPPSSRRGSADSIKQPPTMTFKTQPRKPSSSGDRRMSGPQLF